MECTSVRPHKPSRELHISMTAGGTEIVGVTSGLLSLLGQEPTRRLATGDPGQGRVKVMLFRPSHRYTERRHDDKCSSTQSWNPLAHVPAIVGIVATVNPRNQPADGPQKNPRSPGSPESPLD
jgi:hypothetical protein